MYLQKSKSPNAISFYAYETVYDPVTRKKKSRRVAKLGTDHEIRKKHPSIDPEIWAKKEVDRLNQEMAKKKEPLLIKKFDPNKRIPQNQTFTLQCGYLVLKKIYQYFELDKIFKELQERHHCDFDLNAIFSYLVYARILDPSSKLASFAFMQNFLERPNFQLHQLYRALDIFYEEEDFIQEKLYAYSLKKMQRKDSILYYDCTNYYFEIEEEDSFRRYGPSKEHRPNPIVGMGFFLDASGIPLAFSLFPGNQNEQLSLKPLEKKIIENFGHKRFIVCTDAGLSSQSNKRFNSARKERAYITTQSLKKLPQYLKAWALAPEGWHLIGDNRSYHLGQVDSALFFDRVFYKERWMKNGPLEERLLVSFSLKYRSYLRTLRDRRIHRTKEIIAHPSRARKKGPNDLGRYISERHVTKEGEVADLGLYSLNEEQIAMDESYDGFYAVTTSLSDSAETILKINRNRWKIEACFRTMKSDFSARPLYVRRESRIHGHFLTCFTALFLFRTLQQFLGNQFTNEVFLKALRSMTLYQMGPDGYLPTYTRTDVTDAMHDLVGFRTDYEVITMKKMKKILKEVKKDTLGTN